MARRTDRIDALANALEQGRIDRRAFLVRAAGLGLSASAVASILAACGGNDEPTAGGGGGSETGGGGGAATTTAPEPGGRLVLRNARDPETLDPAFEPGGAEGFVSENIYERLVAFKPGTYELVNHLAEEFTPSEDGLRFDFRLKPNIPFHGSYGNVTADDVKFSYERIAGIEKPDIESPYKDDWATLKEVIVNDELSGTIVLSEPFAPLLTTTMPGLSGRILSRKAVGERGKDYPIQPIGTGPYELGDWPRGEYTELKLFADYGGALTSYGELPVWDEIRFVPIQEDSPAVIALETGEVHFSDIPGNALSRFEGNDDFGTEKITTLGYNWIGMNINHPNLTDVNVRQAIRYAIDVPAILEGAFDGLFTRANAMLAPGQLVGYWEDAPVYERDVEKAQEFLSQAASVPDELVMSAATSDTGAKAVAEIVQANLADIGLNVKVDIQDGSAYWGELGGEKQDNRQMFYLPYTTVGPDPSWVTVWFNCDQIDVWNWMDWCDEEYSRLHTEASRELDNTKRQEMYVQMQQLMDENVNSVWVAHPTTFNAWSVDIVPTMSKQGGIIAWDTRKA